MRIHREKERERERERDLLLCRAGKGTKLPKIIPAPSPQATARINNKTVFASRRHTLGHRALNHHALATRLTTASAFHPTAETLSKLRAPPDAPHPSTPCSGTLQNAGASGGPKTRQTLRCRLLARSRAREGLRVVEEGHRRGAAHVVQMPVALPCRHHVGAEPLLQSGADLAPLCAE